MTRQVVCVMCDFGWVLSTYLPFDPFHICAGHRADQSHYWRILFDEAYQTYLKTLLTVPNKYWRLHLKT